ncbi:hypothetical protein LIER_23911 [Lithospermum erythrorhizon]|uniref:Uncharacterized protein n=1 Tax=Lithospermum erythrorhizon TaxID=34254 RepID=A0AAV3R2F3_LITER
MCGLCERVFTFKGDNLIGGKSDQKSLEESSESGCFCKDKWGNVKRRGLWCMGMGTEEIRDRIILHKVSAFLGEERDWEMELFSFFCYLSPPDKIRSRLTFSYHYLFSSSIQYLYNYYTPYSSGTLFTKKKYGSGTL